MRYTKRLTAFSVGYAQVAVVFPILVAAPRYFSGALTLGELMQLSSAFGQVQDSLSWFVNSYGSLASWKASVDRLLLFQQFLEVEVVPAGTDGATVGAGNGVLRLAGEADEPFSAEGVELALPDGRVILSGVALDVAPGERVLLRGPSGTGKSTLFRALAGIWPFGRGTVRVPEGARTMFLPQKPYVPLGTLRAAVTYPLPRTSSTTRRSGTPWWRCSWRACSTAWTRPSRGLSSSRVASSSAWPSPASSCSARTGSSLTKPPRPSTPRQKPTSTASYSSACRGQRWSVSPTARRLRSSTAGPSTWARARQNLRFSGRRDPAKQADRRLISRRGDRGPAGRPRSTRMRGRDRGPAGRPRSTRMRGYGPLEAAARGPRRPHTRLLRRGRRGHGRGRSFRERGRPRLSCAHDQEQGRRSPWA